MYLVNIFSDHLLFPNNIQKDVCGGAGLFVPIQRYNKLYEYQGFTLVKIKMILKCLIQLEIEKKKLAGDVGFC